MLKTDFNFDTVSIPLGYNLTSVKDSVEVGQKVLAGEQIAFDYLEQKPIFSSVSGEVIALESRVTATNQRVKHAIIKNDFKNETFSYPSIELDSVASIRRRIKDFGLDINQRNGLFTNLNFDQDIELIVIDASSDQGEYFLTHHLEQIEKGLELLKLAAKTNQSKLFTFNKVAVKDTEVIIFRNDTDVVYYKTLQKNKVLLENELLDYKTMFVDAKTLYNIYTACFENLPVTKKYVSVRGNGVEALSGVVYIGTTLAQLNLNYQDDIVIQIDSMMRGSKVRSDEFALTDFISDIYVTTHVDLREYVCTKCGDCNDICPVGILPQNIMDAELRMNEERIFDLDVSKCVECGLCSGICPSNINVLEWVRRSKRRIR
jgi:electron transport complex protein RnfC